MLFWVLSAVITGVAIISILWPLNRDPETGNRDPETGFGPTGDAVADVNVYKDQLRELDADADRGVISPADAEAARVEISRRLLAAADAGQPRTRISTGHWAQRIALACAVFIPIATVIAYLAVGAPGYSDLPRSARLQAPAEQTPVSELVARVEARLKEHPEDGRGWDVIAPIYTRLQRFPEAETAYRNAIRLLGESDQRLAGLAEILVVTNGGRVTDEAVQIYQTIAANRPEAPAPRFWLAVAKEQRGEFVSARAAYQELIAAAPADASWASVVQERLTDLEARLAGAPLRQSADSPKGAGVDKPRAPAAPAATEDSPANSVRGPSREEITAAEALAPSEREAMVRGMIEGLARKLSEDGSNVEGWQRLISAYVVMGEPDNAKAALVRARRALAGSPGDLASIERLVEKLGLERSTTSQSRSGLKLQSAE